MDITGRGDRPSRKFGPDAKPFKNDNIGKDIPAILLEVQTVDKDNLMTTVVKDGYAKFDDVYKNVPADQRPKQ